MAPHTQELTEPVTLTERIAAPPEAVFEFLVNPDKLARWMGDTAQIDAKPGGDFALTYGNGDRAVGTITEIDPPHRLA